MALAGLLRLSGVTAVDGDAAAMRPQWHTIVEGFYLDENGVVLGRCIDLDINMTGPYSPLYYYNRSWRFIGLFNVYQIPIRRQGTVLQWFEALESAWEDTKGSYDRVYFLTQKLLLQEITSRLHIPSTQCTPRPISDIRRYKAQIAIFNDLWKKVLDNKCHNYTSAANSSSGSTLQIPNCPLKTESSP